MLPYHFTIATQQRSLLYSKVLCCLLPGGFHILRDETSVSIGIENWIMKAMSDGGEDDENVYNWQRQVVEEKTEPNSRALFLLYVRDSINKINTHQFRQIDNAFNVQMQGDVTEELVTGNGNVSSIGVRFVEQSFGETVYSNYNTSGGGDGDELLENFSSPYLMPWPQRTAWIAVFTLMLLVATVGNTLVAWIVLGQSYVISKVNYKLNAIMQYYYHKKSECNRLRDWGLPSI